MRILWRARQTRSSAWSDSLVFAYFELQRTGIEGGRLQTERLLTGICQPAISVSFLHTGFCFFPQETAIDFRSFGSCRLKCKMAPLSSVNGIYFNFPLQTSTCNNTDNSRSSCLTSIAGTSILESDVHAQARPPTQCFSIRLIAGVWNMSGPSYEGIQGCEPCDTTCLPSDSLFTMLDWSYWSSEGGSLSMVCLGRRRVLTGQSYPMLKVIPKAKG